MRALKKYKMDTNMVLFSYVCKNNCSMEVVSARDFRSNQTAFLSKAKKGEDIILTSRVGSFKIIPISEEDSLTTRICRGLKEVRDIIDGKAKSYTINEILNEL